MNFAWTINKLKEGYRVRRPSWEEGSCWILGIDQKICWRDGRTAHVHINQIEATDWEIYEEKKESLSEKITTTSYGPLKRTFEECFLQVGDAKEKIQNAQERIKNVIKMPITHKCYSVESILDEFDKIFREEFGEKLIK